MKAKLTVVSSASVLVFAIVVVSQLILDWTGLEKETSVTIALKDSNSTPMIGNSSCQTKNLILQHEGTKSARSMSESGSLLVGQNNSIVMPLTNNSVGMRQNISPNAPAIIIPRQNQLNGGAVGNASADAQSSYQHGASYGNISQATVTSGSGPLTTLSQNVKASPAIDNRSSSQDALDTPSPRLVATSSSGNSVNTVELSALTPGEIYHQQYGDTAYDEWLQTNAP